MKHVNSKYSISVIAIATCLFLSIVKINAQWSELGGKDSSTFNGAIWTITTDSKGNLYASGYDNLNGFYVAKWNGSKWSNLGGVNPFLFNGGIECITTDNNDNVYAAGDFTNNNGKTYVAKWNGSIWTEVSGKDSSTFNGAIVSIATDFNGNIYAGGWFTDTIGKPYVAKWNGNNWSELGGIKDSTFAYYPANHNKNYINRITSDIKGNVYVDCFYTDVNGNSFLAKWSGNSWSEIIGKPTSVFVPVYTTINTDKKGNLFVGGYNSTTYMVTAAKWTDTGWSMLGSSSYYGNAICATSDANSNIYVACSINEGNGTFVTKWNGSTWSILDGGVPFVGTLHSLIECLATDANDNVYAGGWFTNDSGKNFVAQYNQTLPVKLTSINAIQENKGIAINWHTSTELNTSHFIIQHSTDGSSFTDIGTVPATGRANGYSFIDNKPTNGTNYYRLKSVDKDGATSFSKVVSVQLTVNRLPFTVVPNPARDVVIVKGSNIASVQVIDNIGRIVKVVTLKDATNPTLSVSNLKAGVYHLRVQTSDGKVSSVGMVKQ